MTINYRTKDGQGDYEFSLEQTAAGDWRAYIVSQPSYRGQPADSNSTHILNDHGRRYICWTRPIRSREELKQVVAYWSEHTQRYIETGTPMGS